MALSLFTSGQVLDTVTLNNLVTHINKAEEREDVQIYRQTVSMSSVSSYQKTSVNDNASGRNITAYNAGDILFPAGKFEITMAGRAYNSIGYVTLQIWEASQDTVLFSESIVCNYVTNGNVTDGESVAVLEFSEPTSIKFMAKGSSSASNTAFYLRWIKIKELAQ